MTVRLRLAPQPPLYKIVPSGLLRQSVAFEQQARRPCTLQGTRRFRAAARAPCCASELLRRSRRWSVLGDLSSASAEEETFGAF